MKRLAKRPNVVRKALGFETLENRALMAGLTATLTNGVLNVAGTSGNDTIILRDVANQITVDGVTTKFAAANVNSINVTSGGGTDVVEVDTLNVGTTLYNKPIKIVEAGGNVDLHLATGKDVYATGTHTLATDGKGGVTLDGAAPSWADTNVHDSALRQLLDTDLAAGPLDRTATLNVFKYVDSTKGVNATDFADLQAIAKNPTLFGSHSDVAVLTSDVVLGNAANKTYQGATLGNLGVSTTTTTLDTLVSKWFLGTDHPNDAVGSTTFKYVTASGTLFGAGGPVYTDVHQGEVGDCYFVGALGEIALQNPTAIKNMFTSNGDGTYSVRFYNAGKADYVTVDSQLPATSSGTFIFADMGQRVTSTTNVLWVALAEKAYAEINQAGWLRASGGLPGNGVNSYGAIGGGYMTDVLAQVANVKEGNYGIETTGDSIAAAFGKGDMIGLASKSNPTSTSVVGDHQYVVVGYNATTKTFTLFNPWGINNGSAPGLVQMTWSAIQANFSYEIR